MAVTLNLVSEVRTFTTSSGRTVYVLNGQSGFDLDALVAACHSAACRPPKSGGTGGSSDGGKLPPFFAKDADGYQFVGLHFTDSKEFKLGSKTPQGPYASGTRGEIFTTFDPRQPLNNSRDVVTRPFAVEIWAKSKAEGYDYREDVGYEGNQITLNTKRESVRVGKVHQTKDIEAELEKVAQAQWSDDPDALDKVYGISWDKSGNEQKYESRTASGAIVAACHDASCRPPTSGGTGGSRRRGGFTGVSAPRERGDQRPNPRFLQLTKSTMDDEGVGWEDLSTKNRSEKFVASWYEAELPNGFSTKVKATRLSDTDFRVEGTIHNKFGRLVGTFERTVRFDDTTSYEVWGDNGYGTDTTIRKHLFGTTVEHTSLILDSSAQGQGIADALNAHAMKAYQQNGVDNIKVHAGYDVGGYTWAVAGFRIDDGMPNAFGEFRKDTRHVMIDWMLSEGADKASRLVQDGKLTPKQGDDAIKQIEALRKASKAGEDIQPIHIASLGENTHKFKNESSSSGPLTTWLGKEIMLGKSWGGYYYLTREPITASVTIGFGQEFTMTEHAHIPQEEGDINATRDWTEIHEQVAEYLAKYGQTA